MRKSEFVTEYERRTDNSKEIFAQLQQAGYTYLGGGQDATVWGRDEGEVLKVLMPSENKERAEASFLIFFNACVSMPNNPYVPKFVGEYEVFEINGTSYMQITMERLHPIAENSFEQALVWALSDVSGDDYYEDWNSLTDYLLNDDTWSGCDLPITDEMPEIVWEKMRGSGDFREQCEGLFDTMRTLYNVAESNDLGWDLHTENVMQRKDGTLVITDPFFTS